MRVIAVGGGKVGTFIASELVAAGHEVLILEHDAARIAEAGDTAAAAGAEWRHADGCEVEALTAAKPESADVVVAVTGDDEDNLVVSLLCKQEFGVPRVIARVNNPDNEWMFNETWGVDVSVSTPHLLTSLVNEAVSVGSLVRLLSFEGGRVRLSEVTLAEGSPAVGTAIADLEFPRDSTVVAVVRDNVVVVPRGDTALADGDEVLVLVTNESEHRVRELLVGAA
ncbi:MAG: TrkA family potassium uptake protein [Acidimicrobiales bacterium]